MPNRIIKEAILTSETAGSLDDFSWRLLVSLICLADDYGRGRANPAIIKGQAFPLRDNVTKEQIEESLKEIQKSGTIIVYQVEGAKYYYFPKWEKHQTIRAKTSRYPDPANAEICEQMQTDEIICKQVKADAPEIQYNTIQIQSNTNTHFDEFWEAYPRKVAKKDAEKAFAKIKVDMAALMAALEKQKNSKQWKKEGGQYIPYPATWLNQERWNDQTEEESQDGFNTDEFFRKALVRAEKFMNGERDDTIHNPVPIAKP